MKARQLAERLQGYVVLKGHHTAICMPDGHIAFNTTGNAGMATAGSGDVLTGILLGLLTRGYNQQEACLLGVYLHGLAGDLAARDLGQESLMASDIINYLPRAFAVLGNHHTR
jgi:NAD(P)H-hydrate epimerase